MTERLERGTGAAPLYMQVTRLIEGRIRSGEFSAGDRLPTEHELAASLDVSRATIIKAFDALSRRGVVVRRQGSGTFVAAPGRHELQEVSSFSDLTRAHGSRPSQRLVDVLVVPVGAERDDLLSNFPAAVELTVISRIRLVNDVPVGHHRVAVPTSVLADAGVDRDAVEQPDFSLYAALGSAGHAPVAATQRLRAISSPPSIAVHLSIPQGSPVMHARRLSTNQNGQLVEAVDAIYVGSLYEYEVELSPHTNPSIEEGHDHEAQDSRQHRSGGMRVAVAERLRRDSAVGR